MYKIFCQDHVGIAPQFYKTVFRKHPKKFWKKLAFFLAKKTEAIDDASDPYWQFD